MSWPDPGVGAPVEIVHCHAEGEVGDVIVSGIEPPPGDTIWDQAAWIAADRRLRDFVLNEPRGGVFRHVNLLVPPKDPTAAAAFIIMEPEDTPPMSGSNSICVATVLLETGIVPMLEPRTEFTLEAPGGLVEVSADCRSGRAEGITIKNVPSFAVQLGATIQIEGVGAVRVDTAYGGDTFVLVDAETLGISIEPDQARHLCDVGLRVTRAANEQLGFTHPTNPDISSISFCQFTRPIEVQDGRRIAKNAVVIRPGKIDRSPTGTGLSARLAVLHARKELAVGDTLVARSIIDSEFVGTIREETRLGDVAAIRPSISGRAWLTGRSSLHLDPADPWPRGYRLSDTWPSMNE